MVTYTTNLENMHTHVCVICL